jgi:hypothetical protein
VEKVDSPGLLVLRSTQCSAGNVKVYADKLRDWQYAGVLGVLHRIARRGVESSSRLGRHRWKAERSLAWPLATGA